MNLVPDVPWWAYLLLPVLGAAAWAVTRRLGRDLAGFDPVALAHGMCPRCSGYLAAGDYCPRCRARWVLARPDV